MNIQERVNKLGTSFLARTKPANDQDVLTAGVGVAAHSGEHHKKQFFTCKAEEDYEKARTGLTTEEKRIINELHEEFKDYLDTYSVWNICKKFSYDQKISRSHMIIQHQRNLEFIDLQQKIAIQKKNLLQKALAAAAATQTRLRPSSTDAPRNNEVNGEEERHNLHKVRVNKGLKQSVTTVNGEQQPPRAQSRDDAHARRGQPQSWVPNQRKNENGENTIQQDGQRQNLRAMSAVNNRVRERSARVVYVPKKKTLVNEVSENTINSSTNEEKKPKKKKNQVEVIYVRKNPLKAKEASTAASVNKKEETAGEEVPLTAEGTAAATSTKKQQNRSYTPTKKTRKPTQQSSETVQTSQIATPADVKTISASTSEAKIVTAPTVVPAKEVQYTPIKNKISNEVTTASNLRSPPQVQKATEHTPKDEVVVTATVTAVVQKSQAIKSPVKTVVEAPLIEKAPVAIPAVQKPVEAKIVQQSQATAQIEQQSAPAAKTVATSTTTLVKENVQPQKQQEVVVQQQQKTASAAVTTSTSQTFAVTAPRSSQASARTEPTVASQKVPVVAAKADQQQQQQQQQQQPQQIREEPLPQPQKAVYQANFQPQSDPQFNPFMMPPQHLHQNPYFMHHQQFQQQQQQQQQPLLSGSVQPSSQLTASTAQINLQQNQPIPQVPGYYIYYVPFNPQQGQPGGPTVLPDQLNGVANPMMVPSPMYAMQYPPMMPPHQLPNQSPYINGGFHPAAWNGMMQSPQQNIYGSDKLQEQQQGHFHPLGGAPQMSHPMMQMPMYFPHMQQQQQQQQPQPINNNGNNGSTQN